MNISSRPYAAVFQRRLREDEKSEYRNDTIQEAFNYLGVKELAMILHGSSFPVTNQDYGIGSPYGEAAKDVIKFEMLHGFNNNQLGPNGMISKAKVSPYSSSVWQRNELFIDLNKLKTDRYANILEDEDLCNLEIKYPSDGKNYAYTEFYDAFENYDIALNRAYGNFQNKLADKDPKAIKLNDEYQDYKKVNKAKLVKEGLYQVLRQTYATGDFRQWDKPVDRDLLIRIRERDQEAIDRFYYLTKKYHTPLNVYAFGQFLADKQIDENKEFRKQHNFKYINDLLVGFSPSDEWIHQEAFLPDMKMGCPNGGPNGGPQLWGVPVLDPDELFNEDGSLGVAGQLLRDKINIALEDCENVRVDHALGLIDPYIYDDTTCKMVDGKLTDEFYGGNLSHLGIDPKGHYPQILKRIVLPVMREHGLNPEDAVWEDLSNNDKTWFDTIFNKELHLPGITQLEFKRSEGSSRKNWALLGSHDSLPAVKLMKEQQWARDHWAWNPKYLAGFLHWDEARAKERDAFCIKIADSPIDRVKAKFAELFMNSEKIQIDFADFLGINQVYNYGGRDDIKTNWKLRLSKDYEDAYYKNLSSDNPTALNLPEILKIAVKAQMDREYIQYKNNKGEDPDTYKYLLNEKLKPLLERLDKFANILKEKE